MRIVVVGGGMQGCVIAQNLLDRPEKPEVVLADLREPAKMPKEAIFAKADVLDAKQTASLVKHADAVVLAVPSEISQNALSNLIETGVPVSDVCFTPDPPLDLNSKAQKSGSTCVVDCGIAPGLSHILVGAAYAELGGLDSARILVGGMPQNPPPVFKHAVYFNPHDLLAEYVRPARARQKGKDIAPAPLDVPFEQCKDVELGQLEAFLSDGLRSLLSSFPDIPEMSEWTLRWPGHLDTMKSLRELGLFHSSESLKSVGTVIGDRYPSEKYEDVLVMIVEAKKGKETRSWRIIDRRANDQSAMSRTTGFTTAAVAMVLARKQFVKPGVHPPEYLGRDASITDAVIKDLAERGVVVTELVPA